MMPPLYYLGLPGHFMGYIRVSWVSWRPQGAPP